jgi:hypothetical protein
LRTATLTSCQLRRARALLAPQVGRVTRLCRVSSLFALHLTFFCSCRLLAVSLTPPASGKSAKSACSAAAPTPSLSASACAQVQYSAPLQYLPFDARSHCSSWCRSSSNGPLKSLAWAAVVRFVRHLMHQNHFNMHFHNTF